jgi:ATP-dependent helicase/DNAse subunit B
MATAVQIRVHESTSRCEQLVADIVETVDAGDYESAFETSLSLEYEAERLKKILRDATASRGEDEEDD